MRGTRAERGGAAHLRLGVCVALATGVLVACGTTAGPTVPTAPGLADPAALNDRLVDVLAAGGGGGKTAREDYRVGPGDVLEISVYQVDELDRTIRIRPDGSIHLPLVGRLEVAGRTTGDLERVLADRLGDKYLKDPQVSVFVQEHRAHPVAILGEVNKPGVYYLRSPRSLVEMLTEAGGLTEDAGTILHLRRKQPGSAEGAPERTSQVTIDLRDLLEGPDRGLDLMLRDDDSVYVPKAGVVFVEGAVKKPGAYPLHGAATVLKAVAMAGGLDGTARRSGVEVIRTVDSTPQTIPVDFDSVRDDPAADVPVHDGDVVVVKTSLLKVSLIGLYRGITGLVNVTKGF